MSEVNVYEVTQTSIVADTISPYVKGCGHWSQVAKWSDVSSGSKSVRPFSAVVFFVAAKPQRFARLSRFDSDCPMAFAAAEGGNRATDASIVRLVEIRMTFHLDETIL